MMETRPGNPPPHRELAMHATPTPSDEGMPDDEIVKALAGVTLHGWRASYEYPGFIEFRHPESSVVVTCSSDWQDPGTLDVQLAYACGYQTALEGGAVLAWPELSRDVISFAALIAPLLACVLTDFYADCPETKHGQPFYYCDVCETANQGHTCCEYQGRKCPDCDPEG